MDRALSTATDRGGIGGDGGPRRVLVLRGVLASTVAVLAACAAHVLAGGAMPAPALLATVLVLSWLPGVALIGVAVRLWRQAAVIVVAEAMLHAVLALQSGSGAVGGRSAGPTSATGGMTGMTGADLGPTGSLAVPTGSGSSAAMPAMAHGAAMPAWMWASHASAAVLTVLLWRRGEADVARIVALAGRGLQQILRVPGPIRIEVPEAHRPAVALRLGQAVRRVPVAPPRRGPPVAV